jgi:hypothetical protein
MQDFHERTGGFHERTSKELSFFMASYVIFTTFESVIFLRIMVMNPKNHLITAGLLFMFLVTAQHWFERVLDGYLIFFL